MKFETNKEKGNIFEERYPKHSLFWNYDRNEGKTPKDYSYASNVKVWWKCKEGHEWQANICNRSKGQNCPICWAEKRKQNLKNIK